jgi:hypothetical protein
MNTNDLLMVYQRHFLKHFPVRSAEETFGSPKWPCGLHGPTWEISSQRTSVAWSFCTWSNSAPRHRKNVWKEWDGHQGKL